MIPSGKVHSMHPDGFPASAHPEMANLPDIGVARKI
jgi:hypothetical protein